MMVSRDIIQSNRRNLFQGEVRFLTGGNGPAVLRQPRVREFPGLYAFLFGRGGNGDRTGQIPVPTVQSG
jgi:hypothetical protein